MRAIRTTLTLCLTTLSLVACGETPEEARSREHREFMAAMDAQNARIQARVESLDACTAAMNAAAEYFRAYAERGRAGAGSSDGRMAIAVLDALRTARRGSDSDVTVAISGLYFAALQDKYGEVSGASRKLQSACAALQERSEAEYGG